MGEILDSDSLEAGFLKGNNLKRNIPESPVGLLQAFGFMPQGFGCNSQSVTPPPE